MEAKRQKLSPDLFKATGQSSKLCAVSGVVARLLANADVWERIFSLLAIKERIRLELISKGTRRLMLVCWKRVTSFDFAAIVELCPRKRESAFVAICAHRIGVGLRSLTVDPLSWKTDLRLIGDGCPNIESIHFRCEPASTPVILPQELRFDAFAKLKTVSFAPPWTGGFVKASASVFRSIPPSIERIVGLGGTSKYDGEMFENARELEAFFAARASLKQVSLAYLYTFDGSKADVFRVIAARCPQLKRIDFLHSKIHWREVVALESMKQLRLSIVRFSDAIEVCERSPEIEVLDLDFTYDRHSRGVAALAAIGQLTKLVDLRIVYQGEFSSAAMTDFVRELSAHSGASLRRLELGSSGYLPTAAIEALANGCTKLRSVRLYVCVGEASAPSIRLLIDCIVADASWTVADELKIDVYVHCIGAGHGDEYAAFTALSAPEANLPARVSLNLSLLSR